jgi:hypothetical protein
MKSDFVAHFVAELHQLLHCADNHNRGGNDVHSRFFCSDAKLAAVWDTLLIERIDPGPESYATRLDTAMTDLDTSALKPGKVEDGAVEAHAAAKVACGALPPETALDIRADYFQTAAPAVDVQLQRAGIRFAYVLNQALRFGSVKGRV